jgi:adenine-specific DNA-methyltransferase
MPQKIHPSRTRNRPAVGRISCLAELGARPIQAEPLQSSTDDIACWFIDTNYNGESFFVRHAYFTGADQPYDKLKRALRAEIDEGAWSSLYSTVSRPFDPPATGKIAIKVINHYGDEVLKVFEV